MHSATETTLQATMVSQDIKKIGLIAGEGLLPQSVIKSVQQHQVDLSVFCIHKNSVRHLKKLTDDVQVITPGLFEQNLALFKSKGISHLVFAGKVNKWLLFCNPKMDKRAWKAFQSLVSRNDDAVMLGFINEIESEGFKVLPQTDFLKAHFKAEGCLTKQNLTDEQVKDFMYGWPIAKEMGRLDVGQTIVVNKGMLMAVEAIEGTDECLKRAGKWAKKKGGMVIKVAKPNQDQRFDVPTVGLRTLKTMRSAGLNVLLTEANETLFLDPEAMVAYANKHGITIVSANQQQWQQQYDKIDAAMSVQ